MRLAAALVVAGVLAASPVWASEGIFGFIGLKSPKIESIPKWVDVLARLESQQQTLRACLNDVATCPDRRSRDWSALMNELRASGQGRMAQLNAINDFFNDFPYYTDNRVYGRSDVWATPKEFMDLSGDCEDYSIAKYHSLKLLGFREETLRMLVVHDAVRDTPHAVLGVRLDGVEYILDNLATRAIPSAAVRQYTPYYAVNATTRWVFVQPLSP